MEQKVTSSVFTAELKNLAAIRNFVEEVLSKFQVPPDIVSDFIQSVDEAASNIMLHGYKGQPGSIEIEIYREEAVVTVRLRDRAPLFDPTGHPEPDITLPIEKRPFGGMGIYLIRQFMDEMHYSVTLQGGNELSLVRKIDNPNHS